MKKIIFILSLTILLLQSCSSGDNNNNNNSNDSVTDIDGNIYQTVTICNQTWTKENLNVSKYTDGTPIPQVTDPTQFENLTTGAWCYYNNNSANGLTYGKLYNWYAVAGIYDSASATNPSLRKNLAPTGWHIPTAEEWGTLINCLDPNANTCTGCSAFPNTAGGKMKTTGNIQEGTGLWQGPNTDATNASGFSGLPSGVIGFQGTFVLMSDYGYWWSSSESPVTANTWDVYICFLYSGYGSAVRDLYDKRNFISVRCIKD